MSYLGSKNLAFGIAGLDSSALIDVAQIPTAIPAINIAAGTVDDTTFGYLSGVTAPIQTQINNIVSGLVSFEAQACAAVNVNIATPGTAVFDGVTLTVGQFLFLLPAASGGAQTNPAQGGVYTFNGAGSALTRLPNMSTWDEVVGARVFVDAGGTTYGSTIWTNTNQSGGTIGVTATTYIQNQQTYVPGTGVSITGNVISIGQSVASSATPTFASETLTSLADFLTVGTGGTTVNLDASTVTGNFVFSLANGNSVSIIPGSAPANQFLSSVTAGGTLNFTQPALSGLSDTSITAPASADLLVYSGSAWTNVAMSGAATISNAGVLSLTNSSVTGQTLTGLTPALGIITAADTILTAFNKLVFNTAAPVVANIHQTSSYAMTIADTLIVMDADAQTVTLPDATTVEPSKLYTFALGTGALTGTFVAFSGQAISGMASVGISGAFNSVSAVSDGANFWAV